MDAKNPTPCTADNAGHISVTYTTPTQLPSSGSDVLTAEDAPTNPAAGPTSDAYSYVAISSLTWTPTPIAADGSLKGGGHPSTQPHAQAQHASQTPIAQAPVCP